MEKTLLELTTQSRKQKIKDDNVFLTFTNLIKNVKQTKTTKILNTGQFETLLFLIWFLQKRENPALPMEYEIRNGGNTATGSGQEKTLKRICKIQEQHLT